MAADPRGRYALGTDAVEEVRQRRRSRLIGIDYLPPLSRGMSVLDVGCGVDAMARQVSGSVRPGLVVGLGRSRRLIDLAKIDDASNAVNLGFLTGDAVELPFREDRFDLVFSQMALAWVGDAAGAVGEQARVTRPGGLVAAVDVDFDAAVWCPELPAFRKTRAAYWRLLQDQGADPYIGRKLYALLTNAGLERVELQTHAFTA